MKLLTVVGTRPELIRLSVLIPRLDRRCEHVLVHTGQNYDEHLNDIFFRELGLRAPDIHLGIRSASFGEQAGLILRQMDELLERVQPDRVLILGDTNSGLSAIAAARRRTPVFHLEAGNRCYDDRVPEEVNRRIIDHCSTVLLPYTHRSKENLLREGVERERIFVVGNPIYEVLRHYEENIGASDVLERLGVGRSGFILATIHRAENVDEPARLRSILRGLSRLERRWGPVLVSLHPRTRDKIERFGMEEEAESLTLLTPLGFFDFIALERVARCVVTDSGTVQEECAILQVPNVTVRDVTERPETLECGSNILAGSDPGMIELAVEMATSRDGPWTVPGEYLEESPARITENIVLGFMPSNVIRWRA